MNAGRRVLPCPFCGGPAKVHKQFDGFRKVKGYYVCCNKKGCPVFASTRVKKEKGLVIEEWNTRINQAIEALEKYGRHLGKCSGSSEYEGHTKPCHCGYEQALKGE